ncbi:MAG: hypothetical protein QF535_04665, partial [Anaerolineales bacterium]|nr:hypothetical protein [Anaerolineales bacterium]
MALDRFGNLGIGTTDPQAQLQVNATTNGIGIVTNGSVGIGTASPDRPLDVHESGTGYDNIQLANTAATSYRRVGIIGEHGTDAEEAVMIINMFSKDDDTDNTVRIGGGPSGYNAASNIVFLTAANGNTLAGSEAMRINGSGYVGIGTASPQENIHIQDGNNNVGLALSTSAKNATIYLAESTGASYNTNAAYLRFDGTNNRFGIWTGAATPTERFTILRDSGNVGIGTTTPNRTLDVFESGTGYDNIHLSNTASGNYKRVGIVGENANNAEEAIQLLLMFSKDDDSDSALRIGGGISNQNSVESIQFFTAADSATVTGTEQMRIDSSGNVGIGTTSPNYKLDVVGSINATNINATGIIQATTFIGSGSSLTGISTGQIWNSSGTDVF